MDFIQAVTQDPNLLLIGCTFGGLALWRCYSYIQNWYGLYSNDYPCELEILPASPFYTHYYNPILEIVANKATFVDLNSIIIGLPFSELMFKYQRGYMCHQFNQGCNRSIELEPSLTQLGDTFSYNTFNLDIEESVHLWRIAIVEDPSPFGNLFPPLCALGDILTPTFYLLTVATSFFANYTLFKLVLEWYLLVPLPDSP